MAECTNRYEGTMNPEEMLRAGETIQIKPDGWSMYPLFVNGRDWATLAPCSASEIRRGDVVLFRRRGGILVMHRVFKVRGHEFWFVGDNSPEIEKGIGPDQIIGKMIGFVRNGKQHSADEIGYRILSGCWLWMRPLRPVMYRVARRLRR